MARGSQIPKATYEKAIAERPKEIAEIRAVFKDVDAFLTPTHPIVAPLQTVDAEGSERVRQFTVPVSFTGLPAVSVPCGFSPSGLPIGLHIVGNEMQEALLLRIAARLEPRPTSIDGSRRSTAPDRDLSRRASARNI